MVVRLPLYGLSGERIVIGSVGIWKTWRFGVRYSSLGFECLSWSKLDVQSKALEMMATAGKSIPITCLG
jgi:hypothetical protein